MGDAFEGEPPIRNTDIYVHVNNIFIDINDSETRYFCENASSDSVDTLISEPVSPIEGDTMYYIDDWTIQEETDTYVSVDKFVANAGPIMSVIDADNFQNFDTIYTRQIPSIIPKPTTTEGKIDYIYNAYKDIKSAIEEKGVTVSNDINDFAKIIRNNLAKK